MVKVKTVLRYPGGKSRALKFIRPIIPNNFSEFREPFVGGGSVFIDAKQNINPSAVYKINDLNYDLYCFWKHIKNNNEELYNAVKHIKETNPDGKKLFLNYTKKSDFSEFERAVRFFILNRITFSGTVDSGGYSQEAFEKKFTWTSLERIKNIASILNNVEIYNDDYEKLLFEDGKNVFIFLDPPYYTQAKSKLYGKNGDLHINFDHKRFAENMKKCKHKWLITLDDCVENRKMFNFANVCGWELQYGMNNYKSDKANKGKELFICNYDIPDKFKTTDCLTFDFFEQNQLSLTDFQ